MGKLVALIIVGIALILCSPLSSRADWDDNGFPDPVWDEPVLQVQNYWDGSAPVLGTPITSCDLPRGVWRSEGDTFLCRFIGGTGVYCGRQPWLVSLDGVTYDLKRTLIFNGDGLMADLVQMDLSENDWGFSLDGTRARQLVDAIYLQSVGVYGSGLRPSWVVDTSDWNWGGEARHQDKDGNVVYLHWARTSVEILYTTRLGASRCDELFSLAPLQEEKTTKLKPGLLLDQE